MNKWLFGLVLCIIAPFSFAQTASVVKVVEDSSATFFSRIDDFQNQLKMINEAIKQAELASQTLETQLHAIESLSQGDLDGFADALLYQQQTVSYFNDLVNGFDYLKQIEDLKAVLDSPEYSAFALDVKCLDDSMRSSGDFLLQSVNLVKNTKDRMVQQENIYNTSKKTDSITGQLQLQQETLRLLSYEIQDMLIASTALNNAMYTEQQNAEIKAKYQKKAADKIYYDKDTSIFKSEVSDEEYEKALFNFTD